MDSTFKSGIPNSMEVVMASMETGKPTVIPHRQPISSRKSLLNKLKRKKVTPHRAMLKKKLGLPKFGYGFTSMTSTSKAKLATSKDELAISKEKLAITKEELQPSKEELIKLKKTSDTDSDIDVDIDDDETPVKNTSEIQSPSKSESVTSDVPSTSTGTSSILIEDIPTGLTNLITPNVELILSNDVISSEEKYFSKEFFSGRSSKTPERYLKIRHHIITIWNMSKPSYVTKTAVRVGLKSCGDVNSIGRIHLYLEQIGAINFGHVQYIRPLSKLCKTEITPAKTVVKPNEEVRKKYEHIGQRNKKKIVMMGEGGCTFSHNEQGEIIETSVVSHEKRNKPKPFKKDQIQLIACQSFSEKNRAPYDLKIDICALLAMDWHAHTSLNEVMGLLGGTFDNNNKVLTVKKYVPCRSSTNSATHCDMCPVSQSAASEIIQNSNLDVVGWFHSHPTFSPNPSEQDLETQLGMQQYVHDTSNSAFLGIILSPFNKFVSSHVSEYRCLVIKYILNDDNCTREVPFKFHPHVVSNELDVRKLMEDAVFTFMGNINLNLDARYIHNPEITYLQKILDSTKTHLLDCGAVDGSSIQQILMELRALLLNCRGT